MNMIKLNCPSCNGSLELPDNLGVAHCMYCGTRILLQKTDSEHERKALERLIELKNVAVGADNFVEALQYCNSILEIEPKNVEAWIDKAISAFCQTTVEKQRYYEAMEYLKKAEQIDPNNSQIKEVREKLTFKQGNFLNGLGVNEFNYGGELYNSIQPEHFLDIARATKDAKAISLGHYIKGMEYLMAASVCLPDDMQILKNIADGVKFKDWVDWSPEVYAKADMYKSLHAKGRG